MQVPLSRSRFVRLSAGAGILLAEQTCHSAGLFAPASSVLAYQRSTNPDADAITCLQHNDTQCAVDIWAAEFEREPFNDQTRSAYQESLLVHAMRSLDKGELGTARQAHDRALELVPSHRAYDYFEEVFQTYVAPLRAINMAVPPFNEWNDQYFESRYVRIPGILGGQIDAFAMTEKRPAYNNYYPFGEGSRITGDVAARYTVFPMSSNGGVVLIFGYQGQTDYHYGVIDWSSGSSASWSIWIVSGTRSEKVGEGGYLTVEPNTWHEMETRLNGNTFELWVDTDLVGQTVVLDYEPGDLGFGVGLNEYESGTTFSAAFEGVAIYRCGA